VGEVVPVRMSLVDTGAALGNEEARVGEEDEAAGEEHEQDDHNLYNQFHCDDTAEK